MKSLSIYTLVLIFLCNTLSSQNFPFKLNKQQANAKIYQEKPDSTYKISKDTLLYRNSISSQIHDAILYNPILAARIPFEKCRYNLRFALTIDSCYFKKNDNFPIVEDCDDNPIQINFKQGFSITNCTFEKEMSIRNVQYKTKTGAVNITANKSQVIDISENEFNLLNIMNNTIGEELNVSYAKTKSILIAFNVFDSINSTIYVSYSNMTIGCSILENFAKRVLLISDTIKGVLNIQDGNNSNVNTKTVKNKNKTIEFKDCLINSQCFFKSNKNIVSTKLIFENCAFGNSASMFNIDVDTLIFKNCTDMPHPLFLTADSSREEIYIQLINSNVNNIRFDYTDKFRLFFDSTVSDETKNNTYQSLLAKYKSEGKPQNIEKIDIEYKRYVYSENYLIYPLWLLDYVWWRYGYSKWLVVVWTLGFLTLFFVYNYRNWEGMRKIYGVFDKEDLSLLGQGHNSHRLRKKIIYVMLYTSFIFFSLRIDFDKLKYSNNRFLVFFFLQYIVGLICLFFFANAIFKLS